MRILASVHTEFASYYSDGSKEGRVGILENGGTYQRTTGGTGNKRKSAEGTREQSFCFQGSENTVKD